MLNDLPVFAVLKARMQWHQARQKVISENIANADTPGYRARDLTGFEKTLASGLATHGATSVTAARTSPMHLASASSMGANAGREAKSGMTFETRPSGNAVTLEEEMMKLSRNQSDYQAATALYSKSLGFLRIAIGKRA